ncbi:unnamed protein product, partial [Didymodactylos carnosus]
NQTMNNIVFIRSSIRQKGLIEQSKNNGKLYDLKTTKYKLYPVT